MIPPWPNARGLLVARHKGSPWRNLFVCGLVLALLGLGALALRVDRWSGRWSVAKADVAQEARQDGAPLSRSLGPKIVFPWVNAHQLSPRWADLANEEGAVRTDPLFHAALPLILRAEPANEGSATLTPDHVVVNQWASIRLVYEVGSGGMAAGGGIRVQFPKSWHPSWAPTHAAPQTSDPLADYYVSAQTSRSEVTVAIEVKNEGVDKRKDPADWTATLIVGGSLAAGDVITYTFGDRSQGEPPYNQPPRGFQPHVTAMTEVVRVAEDPDADGTFTRLGDSPQLTVIAGTPSHFMVSVPSQTEPGVPFRLIVAAQDPWTNPSGSYSGTVYFAATDPLADLPSPYTFSSADGGLQTFTATLSTTGTHWITVTDSLLAPRGQPSNPIRCTDDTSTRSIYWGDLHSHTEFSIDGEGPLSHALSRMRDQLGLDFYAVTDHIQDAVTGLTADEWQATRDLVQQYYSPGQFVSVLGYEWSLTAPADGHHDVYGHHNVYFQGSNGPLCYLTQCDTLDKLWTALQSAVALTIPHHTGIRWGQDAYTVDWSYNQPEFRTSIEIYSGHGQSEMYDPDNPLSYEHLGTGTATSVNGPHYARDAWALGNHVGVLGGSDSHDVRPALPWTGLTAIYADSLTREALFDAIRARHTYATTGERILLDFRLLAPDGGAEGEAMMGDEVHLPPFTAPTFEVRAVGTAPVDWVELVRFDGITYTVVYSATPGLYADSREVSFRFTDTAPLANALYYVRMQQQDPNRPDRPAMAWSSPIWVDWRVALYLPVLQRGAR